MSDRYTRTRAWDDFWTHTEKILDRNNETKEQKELTDSIDELVRLPLPLAAIEEITAVVLSAYEMGVARAQSKQQQSH